MGSRRERVRLLSLLLSTLLASSCSSPLTDHEETIALLDSLHLRHLTPLPIPSSNSGELSNIPPHPSFLFTDSSLQQLWDDPLKFIETTHLSKTEFLLLHCHLKESILSSRSHLISDSPHHHNMPTVLSSYEQLLLWVFHISGDRTQSLSLHFRLLHTSTIFRIVDHISWCFNTVFSDIISWPTAEQRQGLYGMFSVAEKAVAVLDGTHCPIQKPEDDQGEYYSGYKCRHTQNYLVCTDVLGVIVYVQGPFPGSENDRAVYKKSDLYNNNSNYLSEGEVILADGGFVGGEGLLVPIHSTTIERMREEKTREGMRKLNEEFTSNRIIVEDVFGWLKARAHVLNEVYTVPGR
jgi:hypothetical protein